MVYWLQWQEHNNCDCFNISEYGEGQYLTTGARACPIQPYRLWRFVLAFFCSLRRQTYSEKPKETTQVRKRRHRRVVPALPASVVGLAGHNQLGIERAGVGGEIEGRLPALSARYIREVA